MSASDGVTDNKMAGPAYKGDVEVASHALVCALTRASVEFTRMRIPISQMVNNAQLRSDSTIATCMWKATKGYVRTTKCYFILKRRIYKECFVFLLFFILTSNI